MDIELKDTIEAMQSDDYKDRLEAEYLQLKIRTQKLYDMVSKYEAGTLDFSPACKLSLLKKQLKAMQNYLYALEVRVNIECPEIKA